MNMKPDADFQKATDQAFGSNTVAAGELRSFIERYEHLASEAADKASDMKEVMAEAKGRGYDTKVMRKLIAMRKRDRDDLAEERAIMEMYAAALGMDI